MLGELERACLVRVSSSLSFGRKLWEWVLQPGPTSHWCSPEQSVSGVETSPVISRICLIHVNFYIWRMIEETRLSSGDLHWRQHKKKCNVCICKCLSLIWIVQGNLAGIKSRSHMTYLRNLRLKAGRVLILTVASRELVSQTPTSWHHRIPVIHPKVLLAILLLEEGFSDL